MMFFLRLCAISALCVGVLSVFSSAAFAAEPTPWQLAFQPPASPIKAQMIDFHNYILMPVIVGVSLFVLALLLFVMIRFNKRANPVPSDVTHNVPLEIVWTLIPAGIILVIMFFSIPLLYYADRTAEPQMTLKITGYQWYWGYEYPEFSTEDTPLGFLSNMIPDKDIDPAKGQRRLLSTDAPVVLPVDTDIQLLVSAADVLHSFAVPAFGVKKDAVPGRWNETWVRITTPGTYYGQCSELCGTGHAFMPIEVRAVTKEEFRAWITQQQQQLNIDPAATEGEATFNRIFAASEAIPAPDQSIPEENYKEEPQS